MKYRLTFSLILAFGILVSMPVKASDSIIVKTPVYYSTFEKNNFDSYINGSKTDFLNLALSLDTTQTEQKKEQIRSLINNYINGITPKLSITKNEQKKIKTIFSTANQQFFKKYNLDISFDKLFSTGEFNCLSGTIFYALVLQQLNIPFMIKEAPTHVYILAYPSTFSLLVESTDPGMRYYIPDERFKKDYVNFLVESKIVTKDDLRSKDQETLFNENYYSNKEIKLNELIGLEYYNSGIEYFNEKNYKKAVHQFEKAYILYPSDRVRYMLEGALISVIDGNDFHEINDLDYLLKIVSYSRNKNYQDLFLDKFNNITGKYLIDENNGTLYEKMYQKIIGELQDTVLIKKTATEYYYEQARSHAIKGEIDKGWGYIVEGYKINPVNLDITELMQRIFTQKLQYSVGSDNFIRIINDALVQYPCLTKSVDILRTCGIYYLQKAFYSFEQNDKKGGNKHLLDFENFKGKYNFSIESSIIGSTYSAAASCYYRSNDIKNCKSVLERGLKLSPNNEELVRKYKMNITHEIR